MKHVSNDPERSVENVIIKTLRVLTFNTKGFCGIIG